MAYCAVVPMLPLNLKVGEMPIGLVMSKLINPPLALLLLLKVTYFLAISKTKKMLVSLPLKLSTLLPLQLLKSVLGYINSLQI